MDLDWSLTIREQSTSELSERNFSSLASLENALKFAVCELAVRTLLNLNPSCIELELGLGFDNMHVIVGLGFY